MTIPDFRVSLGLLVLRVGTSVLMLPHGWGKVRMLLDGKWDQMGDPIGIGPHASLILVATAEFLGPILVLLGLCTRCGALMVVVAMCVAAFVAHGADPWTLEEAFRRFMAKETEFPASREPALLFLVPFLALLLAGPGAYSIDAVRARRRGTPKE